MEVWEGERLEVAKGQGVCYAEGESLPLSLPRPGTRSRSKRLFFSFTVDQLFTLTFSPSESSLVYIAEAKVSENEGGESGFLSDYGDGCIGRNR